MRRAVGAYAVAAYALFPVVMGWAVCFIADAGVPRTVDSGAPAAVPTAAAVDVALLAVFAMQHSVMARPWFKALVTRVVPPAAERSSYVLAATLALALVFWQWRPIHPTVWQLDGTARAVVAALQAAGWLLVVVATFQISHTDLFGLRQARLQLRGEAYRPPPVEERALVAALGDDYRSYRRRVPALVPRPRRRHASDAGGQTAAGVCGGRRARSARR